MEKTDEVIPTLLTLLLVFNIGLCEVQHPSINPGLLSQSQNIGECHACKLFIESFQKGLQRTARGKYEGGDAAWEEEKLKKSYMRSEMRLLDIQDGLCKEDIKNEIHCHHMAEKAEDYIEEWWTHDDSEEINLYEYICISKLKVCCPRYHFGKDCSPCRGDHTNLCSGHGKCRGDGTRKGNGTCLCDIGYSGDNCDKCMIGYYEFRIDSFFDCLPCHQSCMGGCRDGKPKDCVACKPGFTFDSEKGCVDINECDDINKCRNDQFCINSLGSFKCMACDKSCSSCHGDGPDMCRKCAKGFSKKDELCIADRVEEDQSDSLTTSRYFTYIGLLVATGILLPKSTHLGSFVGIMVLSYIVVAEYYCMINGHRGLVDLKEFDLMNLFKT